MIFYIFFEIVYLQHHRKSVLTTALEGKNSPFPEQQTEHKQTRARRTRREKAGLCSSSSSPSLHPPPLSKSAVSNVPFEGKKVEEKCVGNSVDCACPWGQRSSVPDTTWTLAAIEKDVLSVREMSLVCLPLRFTLLAPYTMPLT